MRKTLKHNLIQLSDRDIGVLFKIVTLCLLYLTEGLLQCLTYVTQFKEPLLCNQRIKSLRSKFPKALGHLWGFLPPTIFNSVINEVII